MLHLHYFSANNSGIEWWNHILLVSNESYKSGLTTDKVSLQYLLWLGCYSLLKCMMVVTDRILAIMFFKKRQWLLKDEQHKRNETFYRVSKHFKVSFDTKTKRKFQLAQKLFNICHLMVVTWWSLHFLALRKVVDYKESCLWKMSNSSMSLVSL